MILVFMPNAFTEDNVFTVHLLFISWTSTSSLFVIEYYSSAQLDHIYLPIFLFLQSPSDLAPWRQLAFLQ